MASESGSSNPGKDVTIKLVNEDDGRTYELKGGPGTPISTMITKAYEDLRVNRQNTDRLRCENGEDVFQFSAMHLGDYLAAGHCADHTWLFAGATGGA